MLVSFVCVCYNEREDLRELLRSLDKQDYPHDLIELILIDSMSSDGSFELMLEYAKASSDFHAVQVLRNPKTILAAGANKAREVFSGECLVRVDAHTRIPENFLSTNIEVLRENHQIVGGRVKRIPSGSSAWKYTLVAAANSMSSVMLELGSKRLPPHGVEELFFPCIRRDVFEMLGGFDERLERTWEVDFFSRARKEAIIVWYDPRIVSYQKVRPRFLALMLQMYVDGFWAGKTCAIKGKIIRMHKYIPMIFLLFLLISLVYAYISGSYLAFFALLF
ncbi:MAG: glycosyltransferase, partial [Coriobacteriia bacterium]|nr:glycosyltransferase [Coriobacteriia bacterium]